MNDTTDYAAMRRQLAETCCQLRGLNPEHVAPGQTDPLWKTPAIMDVVNLAMTMFGNDETAKRHLDLANAI